MRKLKFHEEKLLKKVDFYDWKNVSSIKKAEITRKYRLGSKSDYNFYQRIVGYITKIASLLKSLPENDEFRTKISAQLLRKLYNTVNLKGGYQFNGQS